MVKALVLVLFQLEDDVKEGGSEIECMFSLGSVTGSLYSLHYDLNSHFVVNLVLVA